jgi:hypothetical protein
LKQWNPPLLAFEAREGVATKKGVSGEKKQQQ